ncbi:MAG: hypothetical protein GKR91_11970 [Pseudomonadales bacterium]|nr:hypothetical protein [Pseudomonadales bacterium]
MRVITLIAILLLPIQASATEYYWVINGVFGELTRGDTPAEACANAKPIGQAFLDSFPDNTYSLGSFSLKVNSPQVPPTNYTCLYQGPDDEGNTINYYAPNTAQRGSGCMGEQSDGGCHSQDDGPPKDCCDRGNPVHALTGNKYQRENFFTSAGRFPLSITTHYNTRTARATGVPTSLDGEWSWNYLQKLAISAFDNAPNRSVMMFRENGDRIFYTSPLETGPWTTDPNVLYFLEDRPILDEQGNVIAIGFQVTTPDDKVEEYDEFGSLQKITTREGLSQTLTYVDDEITVTDDFGNSITLTTGTNRKLLSAVDTDGHEYKFQYNFRDQLEYASYPDLTPGTGGANPFGEDNPYRQYHYEESFFVQGLTGITDENGDRFST